MKKQKIFLTFALTIAPTLSTSVTAMASTLVGDINLDNKIDKNDLSIIASDYNTSNQRSDLNGDGKVDIYDAAIISRFIDDAYFKAFDNNGMYRQGFFYGQLIPSIELASRLSGQVINSEGKAMWNNTSYWTYNSQELIHNDNKLYDAAIYSKGVNNSIVVGKRGSILIDKNNNYYASLAYAKGNINLRTRPDLGSEIVLVIPKGKDIEIVQKVSDFYKVKYYDDSSKTIKDGYVAKKDSYGNYLQDIFTDNYKSSYLGIVSEVYESSGDPGAISSGLGDPGGVSYGAWQFSSRAGSLFDFVTWLKTRKYEFYQMLNDALVKDGGINGTNFNMAWKDIANNYYNEFYDIQHEYIKLNYYDKLANRLINTNSYYAPKLNSFSIRNMLWSLAVQHGVSGAYNLIMKIDSTMTDYDAFIDATYAERSKVDIYFSNSSPAVQQGVLKRFANENADVKRIYKYEIEY